MPKQYYEITSLVVTDGDGLISSKVIKVRELTSIPEEENNEDDNTQASG